jgi:glycosyltransferase involved in cell wall biosynthesis
MEKNMHLDVQKSLIDPSSQNKPTIITPEMLAVSPTPPSKPKKPLAEKKTITLCMIVKDESKVIERCLASVLPVIDHWVILDTGSTDGTQEKIREFFNNVGIPGELHEEPWVDFGTNRSRALELARDKADYSLMIDADEVLVYDNDFDPDKFKKGLVADIYNIFAFYGNTKYHRPQLTSNSKEFYYRGILHEYVDCKDKIETRDFARGFTNTPIQDGARSSNPQKYEDDAKVFEEAILSGKVDEKDFNRYHFYLAQSYRDCQQWEKAIEWYQKRVDLGGWQEEAFYSKYQIGRIMEILNKPIDEILKVYFDAYQMAPYRAEPLWAAARICRIYSRFDQGYRYAKIAIALNYPEGALFVGQSIYEWGIWDEYAICSFWTERYREAYIATGKLLQENKYPQDQKQRIEANHKFAMDAMVKRGGTV